MADRMAAGAAQTDGALATDARRIQNPEALLKVLADLEGEFERLFAEWKNPAGSATEVSS